MNDVTAPSRLTSMILSTGSSATSLRFGTERSQTTEAGESSESAGGAEENTSTDVQEQMEMEASDLVDLFKSRVLLEGLQPEMWTLEHDQMLTAFAQDVTQRVLTVFMDQYSGLQVTLGTPAQATDYLIYFIRKEGVEIDRDNFTHVTQFGSIRDGHLESLLRHVQGVFAPQFFENRLWPEGIRNNFSAHLHKFLASLTDARYKLDGHTVLYIPQESLNLSPAEAAKDKELVQRLETAVVHWTRQIKDVLSAQQSVDTGEILGPLEEIQFWRNRCVDLSGIGFQLDKPGVKHIQSILELFKSSYIAPFLKLAKLIQDGRAQAQSNLSFLALLNVPCQELTTLKVRDIPPKLPHILNLVRVIWLNSKFYNTRDRITALFRKLSNEIIHLCSKEIWLDKIFEGHTKSSKATLNECIECCQAWRRHFAHASSVHSRFSDIPWVLDHTSIFAQVDAFIQRCRDLLEVCDCQELFARWDEGKQTPLPCFGGHRGPEITRGLLEIEATFNKNLQILINSQTEILDVKNTYWHDDYSRFRSGIKDLEVMMQNLISSTFETVTTVQYGVELLEVFHHLSYRETIKRTIDKKTVEVYILFNEELSRVNKDLNRKAIYLPPQMPRFAGQAHWARTLRRRIERSMEFLAQATFLPKIGLGDESIAFYKSLEQSLDEFVRKTFTEWTVNVDRENIKRLERPLMVRTNDEYGRLSVNFDMYLLELFDEIHYWERLLFEIPHYVMEIYQRREELRKLRESVLLVVRDYNSILDELTKEQRNLFKDRIKFLDMKISPGLTKLKWSSRILSSYFIDECRMQARQLQLTFDEYKAASLQIQKYAYQMSDLLLVHIDNKRTYSDRDFQEAQHVHQEHVQSKLLNIHSEIVAIMRQTYLVFKNDGYEVQHYWSNYAKKVDRLVEESFRLNIKRSLLELSKAINGDPKSTPNALFRVLVVLQDSTPGKVEFSPTLSKLANCVNHISNQIKNSLSVFKRIPELLTQRKSTLQSIILNIEHDEEIKKIQAQISNGMATNASNLQNYLKTWDTYREIWEINKDSFIRRYQRLKPAVSSFDADIARYTEVANNVQKEETVVQIQFVLLDCSPLKFSLVQHCSEWQNKFTTLLSEMASNVLMDLLGFLEENRKKVSHVPQNLEELTSGIQLLEVLQSELPKMEARIPPIHEQFSILDKYEFQIDENVRYRLESLNGEWMNFQQTLIDSESMLKKHKEKFRAGLIHSAEEMKRKTQLAIEDFSMRGPFSSALSPDAALGLIAELRSNLNALKAEEIEIHNGLNVFKIDQPLSKELQALERDLDYLRQAWEVTKEWEESWVEWKGEKFSSLMTQVMENTATGYYRKLHKLSQILKDRNWDVIATSKNKVQQFKKTMPLITDLKNPAMRYRHWNNIKDDVQKVFDHTSDDFTLERIIDLGLEQYADVISSISAAASKELSIEMALEGIKKTWEVTTLDLVPYKDKGHYKLKGTDDIFQTLEENQLMLSTMKSSPYLKAFDKQVDYWERCLSLILEVVETILTVQRQWLYLENIFLGEDIRKQLPQESAEFDSINEQWKVIMHRLVHEPNALKGTHYPGLLDSLNGMNGKLEEIEKSLDMYLETKRQIFPRFYFLSNDDLLEILGQSRNPPAVQPHMKKCFDNIKTLKMQKVGATNRMEATGMFSADGEYVEFKHPTLLEGPVEAWLCDVERTMRFTLKDLLRETRVSLKKMLTRRDKWVKEWPGQMLITASQIQWTTDVTKALISAKDLDDKKPLRVIKRKQVGMLHKYSEAIRGSLTKLMRLKIVALVTVEVHARDVVDKLYKINCMDVTAFEWLSQLRLYWDKDLDDCLIRQTNTHFQYGYEYLGNSGRLVITPLTDRCYMTLTTALHLHRGGSPKGPAGTGKTETVKDLGKALGMYVIVVNCSEGLDYKSMGRMYSGLAQTGAWGCFDEFNRINIEVLSVVAQQILSILSALSAGLNRFVFEGREINLICSCGIFITMNPGYAGRTELPDNLKSMFRPISMVVPDSTLIAEIILFAEGFNNCKALAKKVYTLYSLAVQQLSKQDHYDFGLRALTSLLRYAGKKRRDKPQLSDEEILLMSMKDMNMAKLTSVDLPLFSGIIRDLFPGVETPVLDYGKLKEAIEVELVESGYKVTEFSVSKVIQLHETQSSRHSVMIVGKTGSGKTVVWRTLQGALSALHRNGEPYNLVKDYPLNPKAVSLGELYGEYDLSTNEWTDGVLSSLMRVACADEKPDEKWIVFDGPVDTLWIESMNSVMDDNKVLTLINGERISMPDQVSLLFEVENLAVASPATVSRCGMVYTDYTDLGWKPFVESWLNKRPKEEQEQLQEMFQKSMEKTLRFKAENCKELIPIAEHSGVVSLCKLYETMATVENGVNPADPDNYMHMISMVFLFSLIWSVCASVDEEGRKKMDNFLREMDGSFPSKETVYEYYVDPKTKVWTSFEEKLMKSWRYPSNLPFYKIIVPTVDTVRYNFLVTNLMANQCPVLLVGPVGTGKTSVAQSALQSLDPVTWSVLTVNMSAQTTSNNVQEIIESHVEKRTKGVYVPLAGKRLITFVDDLNMPAKDTFGSQPPLELLRLWIDYGFWYDRRKQTVKHIKEMFLMGAMGPPGGGRTVISPRLLSRFNLINMTFPVTSQIKRIFSTMINQKLQDFEEQIKPIGNIITDATIELYNEVVQRFLPTPTRIHYLFNLRDISKVFQGMLRVHKDYHDSKSSIARLWVHECFRVFSDRFVDQKDMELFMTLLNEKLGTFLDMTFHNLCPNKQPPIFGDFMRGDVYEDLTNFKALKAYMEAQLEEYNATPGVVPMSLVLFKDAIEHVTRIVRVIGQPRGNMLLVGIGGSGRQSLSQLSAFISVYNTYKIEVTKVYRKLEFRDDLKKIYKEAGVRNNPTMFLFTDTQLVEESFLEDINNILSSGEVPNLFKADELEEIKNALLNEAKNESVPETTEGIFNFFMERVQSNLHVVLCMSPVGDPFRNRMRQYPALVNCTTIDWFSEWPQDALLEVAERYLMKVDVGGSEELRSNLAHIFVTMHRSVSTYSQKMLLELRRHNYVTPTNYLELVSGYKKLLEEKRIEISSQANKLRNGLSKIDDTRDKVEVMSVELEQAKVKVAEFQKQCEEYLVIIVQQKREADEQQKTVSSHSEKIAAEEIKCKVMAEGAQKELDEALPALQDAMRALESLNKKDMTEIKSYGRPPVLVETVMQAVMILRGSEPTWAEAKKELGEPNFIKQLINFDKDNISDKVLKKIGTYCAQPDFQPEIVGRVSVAAKSLCMWVLAMELYGRLYRVVEPKRLRLNAALAQLAEKQASLAEAQAKLKEVAEKLEMLKKQYDEKLAQKEELRKRSEEMEIKLDRAAKLLSGLAAEKVRWEETVKGLDSDMGYLVGDCLLASAFLSYMGPFLSNYRDEIVTDIWMKEVNVRTVPYSPEFAFANFLSNPTTVRDWNIQGLPTDAFSTENGVIVTRGNRWPLMVDPQGQALKWIKNMEHSKGLKIIDFQMSDYMRVLESGVQFGSPILLQNVHEELDPSLGPILNKSVTKAGGRLLMKLGDKEIEYNPNFRFYITTKLSNPHYPPEISSTTTIVNFAVKLQGLEAQLLGIVVRKERPELEEQKDSLVINIAAGKKKLKELEDEILRLLNEATGSLLDDVQLVNTLQTSKVTATEVAEQIDNSETTEVKIDAAREGYRPCAERASILFFVLNDMGKIDPMYQFSLDAYIDLFNLSIEKSKRTPKLHERIVNLNEYHTYAVYRYTCRGLFERHKLLFSFQVCIKILEVAGKLNMDEYNFFLCGGVVLDREEQMDNPCPGWLADTNWDNITQLDKLTNFHGIMNSFEQYPKDWNAWYTSSVPETALLPVEWENTCNELQRMLIVRSLRQDRVALCVTSFIVNNLGSKFVEPPVLDMHSVIDDSNTRTPLIFVLSPGVDPTNALLQLAEHSGMAARFHALSLGQGQAPIATRMITEGVAEGNWVFLANCHLSLSWMPQLDKLIEQLQIEDPHPDFRLWISSSPHPDFPVSILQSSIKITTEPPKGIKANMKRLYNLVTPQQFSRCSKPRKYKKLLFAMCFFHSLLLERKKFLQLGWNIVYSFNDSDFEVSENLLSIYLDEYDTTPWDALKYLIAGVNYGGHVTDDWDRRLLTTYINDFFCDKAITTNYYKLSSLDNYYIPKDGDLNSYKEYISMLPSVEHPEAFGQHPNADVASEITEARRLFDTLLSLQPQVTTAEGRGLSREEKVFELSGDVLQKTPEDLDYEGTRAMIQEDSFPLNVVLLQEIQRYNLLLNIIRVSLTELKMAIQGLVVMSTDLEEIFNCIHDARVPSLWELAYPSMKPLGAWTRDLGHRVEQFAKWADSTHPPVIFWISGFTFPTGFLTAVLQLSARKNMISVDSLSWEFIVAVVDDNNLLEPPKEGVFIRGMYLEGAGWDKRNACLVESEPMQLVCPIPTIHFKPVENRKKSSRGTYLCPCYYYSQRAGSSRHPSFVVGIELKTGEKLPDHWIKRGTALLMSLDY
ncbi:dynein axonemal heavy chain 2 [Mobula hypostoma]|uniref:dynein axonemal heavy chain 2 n=1 Tax=Mobula hypostoma TaxID=723540 RepID=UPI002FC3C784